MEYRDYETEVILRERMPGYGHSVLIVTTAESGDKAIEAARREFTALTGLPQTLIEEIEAAPIIPLSEAGRGRRYWRQQQKDGRADKWTYKSFLKQ